MLRVPTQDVYKLKHIIQFVNQWKKIKRLLFDPTGTRTHDLPHSRRAR